MTPPRMPGRLRRYMKDPGWTSWMRHLSGTATGRVMARDVLTLLQLAGAEVSALARYFRGIGALPRTAAPRWLEHSASAHSTGWRDVGRDGYPRVFEACAVRHGRTVARLEITDHGPPPHAHIRLRGYVPVTPAGDGPRYLVRHTKVHRDWGVTYTECRTDRWGEVLAIVTASGWAISPRKAGRPGSTQPPRTP